jgi:hypothetical protein
MKSKLAVAALLIAIGGAFSVCRLHAQAADPGLTAHEWGTFTSIAGNDGQAMDWVPLNGSAELPGFLEHFCYTAFKVGLRGTVRMETPVLYFYSTHDVNLSVHVVFSRGLITEWYPHASHVFQPKDVNHASLYKSQNDGSISWDSVSVQPGLTPELPRQAADSRYYAARNTSSAPLRVSTANGDQQEKFLFYRGVAAFPVPLAAVVTARGELRVTNLGKDEIPNFILFERRGEKVGYRIGTQALTGEVLLNPPELNSSLEALYSDLEGILTARGLFRDEAHAMVETWRDSWFEEGSRFLYIVPPGFVDQVLPLTIHPAPANIVRVFVGRLEIVTPATRQTVATALAANDEVTLQKYGRFLEPIMRMLDDKDALSQQNSALSLPCAAR